MKFAMQDLVALELARTNLQLTEVKKIALVASSGDLVFSSSKSSSDFSISSCSDLDNCIMQMLGELRPVASDSKSFFTAANFFDSATEDFTYRVDLFLLDKVESIEFTKYWSHPSVQKTVVCNNDFAYTQYMPQDMKPKFLVLVVGGSEGGMSFSSQMALALANNGIPSIAVPYFKFASLPEKLENIPLEYFEKIWNNVRSDLCLPDCPIVIIGRSRGAELALLLGAHFPDIHGVVAYAPSDVSWTSGPENNPSWVYRGHHIESNPHCMTSFTEKVATAAHGTAIPLVDWYQHCKEQTNSGLFNIAVEKINGPVLLISGKEDQLWPSEQSSRKIADRLKSKNFPHGVTNLTFSGVGHCFDLPGIPVFDDDLEFFAGSLKLSLGGRIKDTIDAEYSSWKSLIEFLRTL